MVSQITQIIRKLSLFGWPLVTPGLSIEKHTQTQTCTPSHALFHPLIDKTSSIIKGFVSLGIGRFPEVIYLWSRIMKTCVQWNADRLGTVVVHSSHTVYSICTHMHWGPRLNCARLVFSFSHVSCVSLSASLFTSFSFDRAPDRSHFHLLELLCAADYFQNPSVSHHSLYSFVAPFVI